MKLTVFTNWNSGGRRVTKLLLIMKLTSIFLLAVCLQAAARSNGQTVSLSLTKAPLKKVFIEIQKQTGLNLFMDEALFENAERVTLHVRNMPVKDVLDLCLVKIGLDYTMEEGGIVVRKKEAPVGPDISLSAPPPIVIKGTVTDENGQPLHGATVKIKGKDLATSTNETGSFSLQAPQGRSVLVVSYVGYEPQELEVTGDASLKVVLKQAESKNEEVVVIGYGTMRKSDLTGSVSNVSGEDLTKRSTQQLSTALQGQMAGVQVTRSSGGPGATASVRIRGVTTLSNNDPLVIVDGVPSSLNDVIASDVESINVLKDAASASIYGSRAAAGVILITTKRAKENQFSLDYNYEYGINRPTARPENGDVINWMNVQNEEKWNDGAADPYSQYSQETINSWLSNNAEDPYHYPNTDWVNLMLHKTTSHEQHMLSVTGGSDKLRTKSTFNYQKGDGYYENKSYDRYAGRVNNDYKITNWLNTNLDLDFSKSASITPSEINAISYAYLLAPYYNAFWEDGRYADTKDGANGLAALQQGGINNNSYYKFGGKLQLNINPINDLTITAIYAPRFSFTTGKKFSRAVPLYYEDGTKIFQQSHRSTNLLETRNSDNSQNFQFYGNYQKRLNDHYINAMVGYEGYSFKWENQDASRNNFLLDNYPYLNIGPEDFQYNSGSAGHNAYESVFSRLMYSYKNKFMVQGNVRSDGSSRFSKDSRWGTFYSMSAGWVISKESWFKNNLIDYLKLRGSIGQLGNERIGSEFPYQAAIDFGNSYMYDRSSNTVMALQSAAQDYYAFENITWETTTTYGVGLDIQLINNRLKFSGDYYYKKTTDMLLTLGFPSYSGFLAPFQNAGDMYTKGWDLALGWSDNAGDFWYRISANLSDYRSRMGYLGDKRTLSGNYIYEEGSYYYEWFMYKSGGLFLTDADLYDPNGNKYPVLTANDKAGDIKYMDTDKNGIINPDDKVRLGNSQPELLYGGNIAMGWKGLDFNMSFQGIGYQRVLFNTLWIQPLQEQWGAVPKLLLGNYWSQHNNEEQNSKVKYPRITYTNRVNTYAGSDYWLFNGAYFRMKNITFGYTLPSELAAKGKMKDLRLYLSINDLPAISKFPKGRDPELQEKSSDFISTSLIFGVNVKF